MRKLSTSRSEIQDLGAFYARQIRRLLDRPDVLRLVAEYLEPQGSYAARTFDELQPNPVGAFCSEDFLAVSFLDTPIKAATYRQLAAAQPQINQLLAKIDAERPLWKLDDLTYAAATDLWDALIVFDGIGPTRASKLMARKRPHLIPILDNRVRKFYEARTDPFWWPLSRALSDPELLERLLALRVQAGARNLSVLRILDIAIWMGERNPPGTVTTTDE